MIVKNLYLYKIFREKIINELLEETIENNFNNLIPSYGKMYFDRIVKYNENFKIISLHNNLASLPIDLKY